MFSRLVIATCGITAGSGHATVELRCLLIDVCDDATSLLPGLPLTVYVDDITVEAV